MRVRCSPPGDAVFFGQRQRIAELALANHLATMFAQREYVVAGGLMSYGENLADFFRRAASYVDKIFKCRRWWTERNCICCEIKSRRLHHRNRAIEQPRDDAELAR
jgi:hypothetical protein